LRRAIELALRVERVRAAELSIAFVNDDEIQRINKQFLNHDFPTDVVSFPLESNTTQSAPAFERRTQPRGAGKSLGGEIVIGLDYAVRSAAEYGWPVQKEVLLYVVHGLLHLCGYDDLSPEEKRIMRRRESAILHRCGISPIPRRRPRPRLSNGN
jgi:probable rRNA maturation factor